MLSRVVVVCLAHVEVHVMLTVEVCALPQLPIEVERRAMHEMMVLHLIPLAEGIGEQLLLHHTSSGAGAGDAGSTVRESQLPSLPAREAELQDGDVRGACLLPASPCVLPP
jgi:hypothetical protein